MNLPGAGRLMTRASVGLVRTSTEMNCGDPGAALSFWHGARVVVAARRPAALRCDEGGAEKQTRQVPLHRSSPKGSRRAEQPRVQAVRPLRSSGEQVFKKVYGSPPEGGCRKGGTRPLEPVMCIEGDQLHLLEAARRWLASSAPRLPQSGPREDVECFISQSPQDKELRGQG